MVSDTLGVLAEKVTCETRFDKGGWERDTVNSSIFYYVEATERIYWTDSRKERLWCICIMIGDSNATTWNYFVSSVIIIQLCTVMYNYVKVYD